MNFSPPTQGQLKPTRAFGSMMTSLKHDLQHALKVVTNLQLTGLDNGGLLAVIYLAASAAGSLESPNNGH